MDLWAGIVSEPDCTCASYTLRLYRTAPVRRSHAFAMNRSASLGVSAAPDGRMRRAVWVEIPAVGVEVSRARLVMGAFSVSWIQFGPLMGGRWC